LSLALRSWSIPKGIEFKTRKEENLQQIEYEHRHTSRLWPAWLKAAWPRAEIWAGWSEVRIPKFPWSLTRWPEEEFKAMKPCSGWRLGMIIKAMKKLRTSPPDDWIRRGNYVIALGRASCMHS
jgi:hypothetical protein